MKIPYTQTIFFLSLFVGIFGLIGCGPKDDDCVQTKYEVVKLSQSENSKVLYSGLDTLKFLTNQNDTILLVGGGKKYFYETEEFYGRPICLPYSSTDYEAYRINYNSIKGSLDLGLELHSSFKFGKVVLIDIAEIGKVYRASISLLGTPPVEDDPYYFNQISLNGTIYSSVRKMVGIIKMNQTIDTTSYVLYNIQEGIIQIKNGAETLTQLK